MFKGLIRARPRLTLQPTKEDVATVYFKGMI